MASVAYDAKRSPNRCSVVFEQSRTRNAERIELFTTGRETETLETADAPPVFLASESFRQVTYSLSQQFGVPRQVTTDYTYWWTFRRGPDDSTMRANLLTSAYFEPQDPLYFKTVSGIGDVAPVVVYSHDLVYKKR